MLQIKWSTIILPNIVITIYTFYLVRQEYLSLKYPNKIELNYSLLVLSVVIFMILQLQSISTFSYHIV